MEQTIIDLYEFATIALPAFFICLLLGHRHPEGTGRAAYLLIIVWVVYLFGLFHYTSAGTLHDILFYGWHLNPDRINLIPFSDTDALLVFNILNIVLFVPLGVLAPLLFREKTPLWKIALLGFVVSLTVELSQLVNLRATDVDDLIMNTLGALIGYGIYRIVPQRWRDTAQDQAVPGIVAGCLIGGFLGRFLLFNEMGFAGLLYGF